MIINAQGKPYSKRDGAAYVGQFREMGYCADALFNFLTLLGWSPGGDREKMTRAEIIAAFSLDRVGSGPAQMDMRKLTHMNGLYLAELPPPVFAAEMRTAIGKLEWGKQLNESLFLSVCKLMQSRTSLYPQCDTWKYFFVDPIEYDEKAVQKTLRKEGVRPALEAIRAALLACDFSEPGIQQAIRQAEAAVGSAEGKLNQPLRIAVTGVSIGAGIYEILALMGRDRTLTRLENSINLLSSNAN
jgi:glutamyl-tRNA synthetase